MVATGMMEPVLCPRSILRVPVPAVEFLIPTTPPPIEALNAACPDEAAWLLLFKLSPLNDKDPE